MQKPCPCSICQSPDHRSSKCPELYKDLETGFYKPAGGMPQGGGDDDEKLGTRFRLGSFIYHQLLYMDKLTVQYEP
jgi:hypothetical protein